MVKKTNLIEKRNILNEIRCNNMLLQELRFFTIYLSKINAREPEKTRNVKFSLSDFLSIMGIEKANVLELKKRTDGLLQKIVHVPTPNGGWTAFQLFKRCKIDKNNSSDEWSIEIDAHDDALPLMFEFKRDYFTYELWNALRLTSSNQLRMYEILKEYERIGSRTIKIEDLRGLLFISKDEYPRFNNFKIRVIDACQQALLEHTDIKFDYELIKKAKGKVIAIRFTITKNGNFIDPLTLGEFIDLQKDFNDTGIITATDANLEEESLGLDFSFFADAFNNEFTIEQTQELYQLSINIVSRQRHKISFQTSMYDYLLLKFRQLNAQKNVMHRYAYLKKLIKIDIEEI